MVSASHNKLVIWCACSVIQRLKSVFKEMDVDGDGLLHVDEFEDGLHRLGNGCDEFTNQLLQRNSCCYAHVQDWK